MQYDFLGADKFSAKRMEPSWSRPEGVGRNAKHDFIGADKL